MRAYHLFHPLCILIVLSLAAPLARGQSTPSALNSAVDAAWQRSPQARTLEARRDETLAGRDGANTWIAGSPTVGLSQRSDRWTDQLGAQETEVSLAASIWLPGQKAARLSLADSSAGDLEAQIAVARLTVAGEVRERLWAVAAAREAVAEAADHQHHLEGIAEAVTRRVKAGDLARSDGLLAQQEVLAAQGALASAQLRLAEALTRYRQFTGQSDIPNVDPEPLAQAMQQPHPRLLAASAALQHAKASVNLTQKVRSDPPTVGMSMRQERERGSAPNSRSIGVALQIPIGTHARNRPLEAAARTQLASASAEAAQLELALRAEFEGARQGLQISQAAYSAATARAALTREHTQLIDKAFRLGERGLSELLRAEVLSHEAEMAQRQQRVAVGLAHARLNQASGVLP